MPAIAVDHLALRNTIANAFNFHKEGPVSGFGKFQGKTKRGGGHARRAGP